MNIELRPGIYVVAVSGGVDSMVLLDLLIHLSGSQEYQFVIAHLDHGIRTDSALDRQLVSEVASDNSLIFEFREAKLGSQTSEDEARQARYEFLRELKVKYKAKSILTAHHQDDVLETAIHNLLRGTNRRGLIALRSRDDVARPLLNYSKQTIMKYAEDHGLRWREDSTNHDLRYRRNYIRHKIIPKLSDDHRLQIIGYIKKLTEYDKLIEKELTSYLDSSVSSDELDRKSFIGLPHAVSREVMTAWIRRHGVQDIDRLMIERLVHAAKTYMPGKEADIDKTRLLRIGLQNMQIIARDR